MSRKATLSNAMRFMPLADIFVGATACLLILIIVARQAREKTTTIPQTDLVFACSVAKTQDTPFMQADAHSLRSVSQGLAPARTREILSRARKVGRLSIKVMLLAGNPPSHACMKKFRKMVRNLNRNFEMPDTAKRPASYILLDIAPVSARSAVKPAGGSPLPAHAPVARDNSQPVPSSPGSDKTTPAEQK